MGPVKIHILGRHSKLSFDFVFDDFANFSIFPVVPGRAQPDRYSTSDSPEPTVVRLALVGASLDFVLKFRYGRHQVVDTEPP